MPLLASRLAVSLWMVGALLAVGLVTPRAADSSLPPQPVLLWEITAPAESAGRVYLLGATHVGETPIESFDPVIEDAFARADALVLEADARKVEQAAFQHFLREAGHWQDGTTLEAAIEPALFAKLQRTLRGRRLRPEPFAEMKPWLVALMLSGDALSRSGYRPLHGMERYFVQRVAEREVIELEGARPQILALDRLDRDLQEQFLSDSIEQLEQLDARVADIYRCWDRGDAACLDSLLFERDRDQGRRDRLRERMYFARNRSMAGRLEAPLRSGETWFAVVGAGHVVGEQGIPAVLERRGFRVRQLHALSPERPLRRLARR